LPSILEIINNTVEFKNFGFNAVTTSFIATLVITMLQIIAAIKQKRKIKLNQYKNNWTLTLFAYLSFYFLAFIFYGISRNSIALFLSGIPGFFYIPILIHIWLYKENSKLDRICSILLFFMIPFIAISQYKGLVILFIFSLGAASMLMQTYKMIKAKDYKDVEPAFLFSFFISSLFWFIYSTAINDRVVQVSSGLSLVFLGFLVNIYYQWKHKRSIK